MSQVQNTSTRGVRTYGNFRKPASAGLMGLGTVGTAFLLFAIIVMVVLLMLRWYIPVAIWVVGSLSVLVAIAFKDVHGRSGGSRLATAFGWLGTRRRGAHLYRSGPLGRTAWGTCQLPGLLASTRLHEAGDSYGRRFGMVEHTSVGHYAVVIGCEPDGSALVDPEQIDAWVAAWGQWLAALGQEAGLVAAAVTVETAPDTGARLRQEVTSRMDEGASDLAKAMLSQVIATYPTGSAQVRAWVALTFDGRTLTGKRRDPDDVARDLGSRLPQLTQTLSSTGAGPARPLDAQALCEVVRVAYDPAAARVLDEIHSQGHVPDLTWDEVGPTAAQASWDHYAHDGAWSRTWMMTNAPRGEVFSSVLTRLLSPHGDVDRKRVTLIYRPLDSAVAARVVEADRRAAEFNATSTTRPSARAAASVRAARATAEEEAKGAGLVNFGLLVTATVTDPELADDARAAVESLGATARLLIRPVYGSQDTAFAACLPLGMVLQSHTVLPTQLRSAL